MSDKNVKPSERIDKYAKQENGTLDRGLLIYEIKQVLNDHDATIDKHDAMLSDILGKLERAAACGDWSLARQYLLAPQPKASPAETVQPPPSGESGWPRWTVTASGTVSVYRDAKDHGLFWSDYKDPGRGMWDFATATGGELEQHETVISHVEAVEQYPNIGKMFPLPPQPAGGYGDNDSWTGPDDTMPSSAKHTNEVIKLVDECDQLRQRLESVEGERDGFKAQLSKLTSLLPDTYYADRDLITRVSFMVDHWRRLVLLSNAEENKPAATRAEGNAMTPGQWLDYVHPFSQSPFYRAETVALLAEYAAHVSAAKDERIADLERQLEKVKANGASWQRVAEAAHQRMILARRHLATGEDAHPQGAAS